MEGDFTTNPSLVDTTIDCRAVTFENPTGARGAGGTTARGRKGAPSAVLGVGERAVLADLEGPGTIRHLWMTTSPSPPESARALRLEVFYDGSDRPSICVPVLDFFCLPHGRRAAFSSSLVAAQEGRGLNTYVPIPFRRHVRVELTNESTAPTIVYYQIDYTLEPAPSRHNGYLHASFRRENPTTMGTDFVISADLAGPGRYLGCCLGIRVLDEGMWYGEGEVKLYRDGDTTHPTICGTGLEDYVGSAWGLGPHAAPYGGCTLDVRAPGSSGPLAQPDLVGLYRWHLVDPIMFEHDLRVTVQQLGAVVVPDGGDQRGRWESSGRLAGNGWVPVAGGRAFFGIVERADDYCATAFTYCLEPQPVPVFDLAAAVADVGRLPYETVDPMEVAFGAGAGP